MSDFWVFGYGSLMWNPGFPVMEKQKAKLFGLHRSLCIHSWVHRGTRTEPGLVLGLDFGGSCHGMALRASGHQREEIIDYLRERELVTDVYIECWRTIRLASGDTDRALVYRVDRNHEQYSTELSLERQADIVRRSKGKSGLNIDYLESTVKSLRQSEIRDGTLEALYHHVAGHRED